MRDVQIDWLRLEAEARAARTAMFWELAGAARRWLARAASRLTRRLQRRHWPGIGSWRMHGS